MRDNDFPRIEGALRAVEDLAGRLAPGDVESHVLRSLGEVRAAFTTRSAVEPAVDRLLQSLRGLQAGDRPPPRRPVVRRERRSVGRVLEAVEEQLLPALRRVGFLV